MKHSKSKRTPGSEGGLIYYEVSWNRVMNAAGKLDKQKTFICYASKAMAEGSVAQLKRHPKHYQNVEMKELKHFQVS